MPKRKANELAALPKKAPADPLKVPFETVVAWVFRSGTKIDIEDDAITIHVPDAAPAWLVGVLEAWRGPLTKRARCQALDAYISERKYRLQMGASPELIVMGVPWLLAKCDELCQLSGSPTGYNDPGNIFSHDCVEGYRETLRGLL